MVDAVAPAGLSPGPSSSDPVGDSSLGKDEFLRLLMTQMANQDPTEPQSNEDFIAQLAQFAALESNQAMAGQLEALLVATSAQNQMAAVQLVGKDVTVPAETVQLQGDEGADVIFQVDGVVDSIQWTVVGEDGELHTETLPGPHGPGPVSVHVDAPLADGEYDISATAMTEDGPVSVDVLTRQRVDGVSYESGVPMLMIGGELVPMSEVVEVLAPRPPSPLESSTRTNPRADILSFLP